MAVGDIEQIARGQNGHGRIGTVPGILVIFEADSVLARASVEQIIISSDPGDPIARCGRFLARRLYIPERDVESAIGCIDRSVPVAVELRRQRPRIAPGAPLVIGKHDLRILPAGVFAQQHGDLFAVGGTDHTRLAEVHLRGSINLFGFIPGQAAVNALHSVKSENSRTEHLVLRGNETAIIVEKSHVVARFLHRYLAGHGDDSAPFSGGFELAPGGAIILRNRIPCRIKSRPDDQPLLAGRVYHPINMRRFQTGSPAFGHFQALAPIPTLIIAPLEDQSTLAVTARINAVNRFAILQHHRAGMAQVLPFFLIHHFLHIDLPIQVNRGN